MEKMLFFDVDVFCNQCQEEKTRLVQENERLRREYADDVRTVGDENERGRKISINFEGFFFCLQTNLTIVDERVRQTIEDKQNLVRK